MSTEARFKVGDRVIATADRPVGREGVIVKFHHGTDIFLVNFGAGFRGHTGCGCLDDSNGWNLHKSELRLITPTRPCIVARLNSIGEPLPATRPMLHADRDAATAEAERLALANAGTGFAVYELVSTSAAPKPVVATEAA